eukprot:TRINITY_DN184_c0_g4_i2.p1 TRINITY_DN184_c0_g4~~TRINITY_DN184_c0_g4_i2.p1  ORF type:complete len:231 (-),score=56.65 TRINITY_DN184_c0_g4_i2:351-1043(-)
MSSNNNNKDKSKGSDGSVEDINAQDDSGYTPLYHAAMSHSYDKMNELLLCGANPNLQDAHGRTVLHYCCENPDTKGATLILEKAVNLNPNVQDLFLRTPLHWSAKKGLTDIVSLLIALHPQTDINSQTIGKDTPLHWACLEGNFDICKILLNAGAKVNLKNEKQETPLDVTQNERIIQILKESLQSSTTEESGSNTSSSSSSAEQPESYAPLKLVAKPQPVKKLKITLKK